MNRLLSDYLARYNKGILTTGIISIVLGAGIALCNTNFAYNALLGPFPLTSADLESFKPSALIQKYYVVARGQKILHTGLAWYKVKKHSKYDTNDAKSDEKSEDADSSSDYAEYYMDLLLFDKHLVPLKTIHEEEDPVIIGELKEPEDSVMSALRGTVRSKLIADRISPVMLEQSNIFKATFWALMILIAGLLGFGLFKVATVKVAWKELEKHPLGKAMAQAGGFNSMRVEIEQDFDHLAPADGMRKVVCGKKWLLVEENNKPGFIAIKNIVWVYASNTPTSRSFVTTNVYSLIVCTTDGVEHAIVMPKKDVDEMVLFIGQNAPWALVGFDGARALRWNAHKKKLIAEIEQARDQLLRKA